ncbi:5-methylcytosine restriction system specificity protein McrC [Advenella incenata]
MIVVTAEERKVIDISVDEIVLFGGKINIYPNVKNFFSIDYKPREQKLSLVAGGYIGLIPLNEKISINIKPKFPIPNLIRLVSLSKENLNSLDFFSKLYQEENSTSNVIFVFMVRTLVSELRKLTCEGVMKLYVSEYKEGNSIRGKLNYKKSIQRLWSRGHFHKAAFNYFDFSIDNEFNRTIKRALIHCIYEIKKNRDYDAKLLNELIDFHRYFESVGENFSVRDLDCVRQIIRAGKVPSLRDYYLPICRICIAILSKKGINFENQSPDIELRSYFLDVALIFEKYLFNSLVQNIPKVNSKIQTLDGNFEGRKKFFNQPSIAGGDAKPDIILRTSENFLLIADVKYKSNAKESDRYQIISHAISYDVKRAVLVLPREAEHIEKALIKIGSVGTTYEIDVYEYYFNLSNPDLEAEEKKFAEALILLSKPTEE